MKRLALLGLIGCTIGCSSKYQRFVPMPRTGDDPPFVLDTKTGQFCNGSPRQSSVFPLCYDLYTGKVK
jgi:hypothetical protein